ncbi:hypothetical protein RJ640_001561, partial [Escallonia rubra]
MKQVLAVAWEKPPIERARHSGYVTSHGFVSVLLPEHDIEFLQRSEYAIEVIIRKIIQTNMKLRRNPTNQSHQRNNGDWNARENSDACYECGRTGHIKKYCPQLKNKTANSNSRDFKEKKFKSRKALLTWDDSDESDKEGSEDEDVAQLCFMANDDDLKLQNEKELKLVKIRSDHG